VTSTLTSEIESAIARFAKTNFSGSLSQSTAKYQLTSTRYAGTRTVDSFLAFRPPLHRPQRMGGHFETE